MPDDRELANRFARLRREQREAASPFTGVVASRGPTRRPRLAFAAGVAAAVTVIAAGALVFRHELRSRQALETPAVIDLRSAHWTAPTDFLLDVPGDWLLRDLPRIAAPASLHFDIVTYRRVSS